MTTNNAQSTFVTVLKGRRQRAVSGRRRPHRRRRRASSRGSSARRWRRMPICTSSTKPSTTRTPQLDYRDRLRDEKYDVFLLGDVDAVGPQPAHLARDGRRGRARRRAGDARRVPQLRPRRIPRHAAGRRAADRDGPRRAAELRRAAARPTCTCRGRCKMLPDRARRPGASDPARSSRRRRRTWRCGERCRRSTAPTASTACGSSPPPRSWPRATTRAARRCWCCRRCGDGRTAALAVDSTWHWQMEGFGEVHRRFWRQLVLWLAKKDETAGERVWVRLDQRRYQQGSRVDFTLGAEDDAGRAARGRGVRRASREARRHDRDGAARAARRRRDGQLRRHDAAGRLPHHRRRPQRRRIGRHGDGAVQRVGPGRRARPTRGRADAAGVAGQPDRRGRRRGPGAGRAARPAGAAEGEGRRSSKRRSSRRSRCGTAGRRCWRSWGCCRREWYLRKRWGLV